MSNLSQCKGLLFVTTLGDIDHKDGCKTIEEAEEIVTECEWEQDVILIVEVKKVFVKSGWKEAK